MVTAAHTAGPDVLITLLKRAPLLEALRDGPLDRRELQDRLGVSRATSHRYTRRLGELGLVERSTDGFRLTAVGEHVTEVVVGFRREVLRTLELAPILEAVREAPVSVDVEAFSDATVTTAVTEDPYSPLRRFVELLDGTGSLRGVDTGAIALLYLDEIHRLVTEGMETDVVSRPDLVSELLEAYPKRYVAPCSSGRLRLRVVDDLPFSAVILDDRATVAVRNGEGRSAPVIADTDDPKVRAWAERAFETYVREAVPMEAYSREALERAVARL
jgi:predicted transcriptional regulator